MRAYLFALLVLYMSGCSSSDEAALRKRTLADIRMLSTALVEYQTYYGRLLAIDDALADQPFSTLIAVLAGSDEAQETEKKNSNRVQFLILGTDNPGVLDPWGCEYHVRVDSTKTGFLDVGGESIRGPFAIWSNGPNKRDELGKGDDIVSWEKQ